MNKQLQNSVDMAEKFRAIGHPVRVAILKVLCNCGCSKLKVKNIYEALNLDQPSTSRHLDIMRQAGVLERQRIGNDTFYYFCLSNPEVRCIKNCFDAPLSEAEQTIIALNENE